MELKSREDVFIIPADDTGEILSANGGNYSVHEDRLSRSREHLAESLKALPCKHVLANEFYLIKSEAYTYKDKRILRTRVFVGGILGRRISVRRQESSRLSRGSDR